MGVVSIFLFTNDILLYFVFFLFIVSWTSTKLGTKLQLIFLYQSTLLVILVV